MQTEVPVVDVYRDSQLMMKLANASIGGQTVLLSLNSPGPSTLLPQPAWLHGDSALVNHSLYPGYIGADCSASDVHCVSSFLNLNGTSVDPSGNDYIALGGNLAINWAAGPAGFRHTSGYSVWNRPQGQIVLDRPLKVNVSIPLFGRMSFYKNNGKLGIVIPFLLDTPRTWVSADYIHVFILSVTALSQGGGEQILEWSSNADNETQRLKARVETPRRECPEDAPLSTSACPWIR